MIIFLWVPSRLRKDKNKETKIRLVWAEKNETNVTDVSPPDDDKWELILKESTQP